MRKAFKDFIESHVHLLENGDIATLYSMVPQKYEDYIITPGNITELCFKLKLNPLEYLPVVPEEFAKRTNLAYCVIPDHIKEIRAQAFAHSSIDWIKFSKNLECISNGAFLGCKNLKEIILPSTLRCIKENAFFGTLLSSIRYAGTCVEWQAVAQGHWWIFPSKAADVLIECSDGKVRAEVQ